MIASIESRPLALALALLAGCTTYYDPCFTPASEVSGLQVLAVRADPPEAVLNPDGSTSPVSVQALVVDPDATFGRTAVVSPSICVPSGTRRCDAATRLAPVAGKFGPFSFSLSPMPDLLAAAVASDPLLGYGGIRVQLALDVSSDFEQAHGEKLLLFSPPSSRPPNHGFEIIGLEVNRYAHQNHEESNFPPPPDHQVLKPGEPLLLDVGDPVYLRPLLSAGAQEEYDVVDLSGRTVHLREQISYTFYTPRHGEFSTFESSEPDPAVQAPEGGLTNYRFLKYGGGAGDLWVVARDSRGAQTWLTVPFGARDARTCFANHDRTSPCPLLEFGCL